MTAYVSFDIETHKIVDLAQGDDILQHSPLGIACAAMYVSGDNAPLLFSAGHGSTYYTLDEYTPSTGDKMSPGDVCDFIRFLYALMKFGYTLVGVNSLGFDLRVMADECEDPYWAAKTKEIAAKHIDMSYFVLAQRGYMVGLQAMALGAGLSGKTEGMHGDMAPKMWQGADEDRRKVLQYVGDDVIQTLELAKAVDSRGRIDWVAKSGRSNTIWMPDNGWLTAAQCTRLPEPDTSWMKNAKTRESCYGWVGTLDEFLSLEE